MMHCYKCDQTKEGKFFSWIDDHMCEECAQSAPDWQKQQLVEIGHKPPEKEVPNDAQVA
jgi:hypothetical protein